jgi:SAM-dependent MidA family methyltransferase
VIQPTPLVEVIKSELRASGDIPMSIHRFMELGLSHPAHGYYSTKDKIFNKGGDFTTSPEISQMFGESLGIWMIAALQNNLGGTGNPFSIVEVGPGSGIMMADVLRTVSQFTGSLKNLNIALVETSPNLMKQ